MRGRIEWMKGWKEKEDEWKDGVDERMEGKR